MTSDAPSVASSEMDISFCCRYTPDGREFRVHSETSRVEVKEEMRQRSLEPDDIHASSITSSTLASVLSDSHLPSTSTSEMSSSRQTRRFYSQQCLTTRPANVLLDQVYSVHLWHSVFMFSTKLLYAELGEYE